MHGIEDINLPAFSVGTFCLTYNYIEYSYAYVIAYVNSTDCNTGYNMDWFRQYDNINSQVAEQSNAALDNLRSMLSYCNQENFNSQLQLYLWFRNQLHSLGLREPVTAFEQQLCLLRPFFTK